MGAQPALVATALLAAVLAGCAASPPASEPGAAGSDPDGPTSEDPSPPVPAAFPGTPMSQDQWFNASFPGMPECNPGACQANSHPHDLTHLFPRDYPARVSIRVQWAMGPGVHGTALFFTIDSGDARVFATQSGSESGVLSYEAAVLLGTTPFVLHVVRSDGGFTDRRIDYAVHVAVRGHPAEVPPGAMVRFGAPPGADVVLEPVPADADPKGILYSIDGTVLHRFDGPAGNQSFPLPGPGGPFVLLVDGEGPALRIWNASSDVGQLRIQDLEPSFGPARASAVAEPTSWAFDVDRAPVSVGLYVVFPNHPNVLVSEMRLKLTAPGGDIFDYALTCQACILSGGGRLVLTGSVGHPLLEAGTYTGTYANQDPRPMEVGDVVFSFKAG